MNLRPLFFLPLAAGLLLAGAACKSTDVGFSPTNYSEGGGANMSTNIISPQPGQVFPAGKDIPIEAIASDQSGVNQVTILVNNKAVAKDSQAPYTATLSKPAPGRYAIQSYATSKYGDNKLSSIINITVK